ncbi:tRNA (5-methylaminomethyl-2-thiouridylate)-methyltransferase [Thecamonas trahens ATCC 50062]|uniref:tRNA-5-taurinomethyluridine 2-sulfurtransferase n=1 Tax=Thecamonas trahens ATCC 50062 TaxID=461836 RepID=A0A0L0D3Q3_THETB|nr:tRNA (5-methylaminomethyl-2-thiouridylate)-methyltransferase [Thecamonas trahens ATCC 50062]KNC46929.1 tRNA (5-methylaminomethyl-2-thiouridylate)-methyltransferase [Thecamonas trahens ATCC 50062]|eukprot:XP_013760201.1 tRNA (5-methylaminomethyl-2-thiouridylate)-methyltransferase [Thecamonas trahens ATCC 50062]
MAAGIVDALDGEARRAVEAAHRDLLEVQAAESRMTGKRVALAVSGGVDSAVAALILASMPVASGTGKLVPVHMANWDPADDELGRFCTVDADRRDAKGVVEALGLPPLVAVDLATEYWNEVFQPTLDGYAAGETPNPDMACNSAIKFGALVETLRHRLEGDDVVVATGHYASSSRLAPDGLCFLAEANDTTKDQTYFLARTRPEQIHGPEGDALFPLAALHKTQVRAIAASVASLAHVAAKRESMGICFVGKRKFGQFLQQYVPDAPGEFRDLTTGTVLGRHAGVHTLTIGQRARLGGLPRPMYLARKDVEARILYLVDEREHPLLMSSSLQLDHVLDLAPDHPDWVAAFDVGAELWLRTRHLDPLTPCSIAGTLSDSKLALSCRTPVRALAPGQVGALYGPADDLHQGIDHLTPTMLGVSPMTRKPLVAVCILAVVSALSTSYMVSSPSSSATASGSHGHGPGLARPEHELALCKAQLVAAAEALAAAETAGTDKVTGSIGGTLGGVGPDVIADIDATYLEHGRQFRTEPASLVPARPDDYPKISLVLQYFKHPENVEGIVAPLASCRDQLPFGIELLANVDSQDDDDVEAWRAVASEWVVPVWSGNIHEIRGYNRLGHMARGEIVVFLQDDDIPPSSCRWLVDLDSVYNAFPSLAVVGLKKGVYRVDHKRWAASRIHFRTPWLSPWEPEASEAEPDLAALDDKTDKKFIHFQFMLWVDYAPFAISKTAFERLGGVDETYSPPGESGIFSDVDLCYRAWQSGWRVGHMDGGWGRRKGAAWTTDTVAGRESRRKSELANLPRLEATHYNRYVLDMLSDLIQTLNDEILVPIRPGGWFRDDFMFHGEHLPQ